MTAVAPWGAAVPSGQLLRSDCGSNTTLPAPPAPYRPYQGRQSKRGETPKAQGACTKHNIWPPQPDSRQAEEGSCTAVNAQLLYSYKKVRQGSFKATSMLEPDQSTRCAPAATLTAYFSAAVVASVAVPWSVVCCTCSAALACCTTCATCWGCSSMSLCTEPAGSSALAVAAASCAACTALC